MSSLLFSSPHPFIKRMPLLPPLPCDFTKPPGRYVDCVTLGIASGLNEWLALATGDFADMLSRDSKWTLVVRLRLPCSCHLSGRTWPCPHRSWKEEMLVAELDLIHFLEPHLANPSSLWLSHRWPAGPGARTDDCFKPVYFSCNYYYYFFCVWWFIKQHCAVET